MSTAEHEGPVEYVYRNKWPISAAIVILLIMAAVVYFISPLLDGIVFGIFFAYVTRPIKDFLCKYTRFAPLIATFCILLPIILIFIFAAIEVNNQISWLTENGGDIRGQINSLVASFNLPPGIVFQLNNILTNLADYAITFAKSIPVGATVTSLLLLGTNALVSLFMCYYLLKDGNKIVHTLRKLTPAKFMPAVDFFTVEADRILFGIYIGTFYTALCIAVLSAILLLIFGVPHVVLLTAFVFLAAMVPILSGMMVFLPLTAYLYVDRGPALAFAFLVASVVFVYLPPDFIIRPYLISKASNLHPLLIILSFIGGGLVGGISGFFAAPLVFGLLVAVYRTYLKFGEAAGESLAETPVTSQ